MKTKETSEQKNNPGNFLKGLRAEWGKISWPQKPQIMSETIIVLLVVAFFTVVVLLLDLLFSSGLSLFGK